jgi:hypothetical protein
MIVSGVGVDLFFVQQHIRTTGRESGKGCLCGCAVCWCRQVSIALHVRHYIVRSLGSIAYMGKGKNAGEVLS